VNRELASFILLTALILSFVTGADMSGTQKSYVCNIDLVAFYKKRYMKILPFFTFIVLIDVCAEFSKQTIMEALANVSLTFGLYSNNIKVIGVGWFLGLIFVFYMIFPFYCVLIAQPQVCVDSICNIFVVELSYRNLF
jgi:peptidoglycan/LPS O-acetylase OafA/YrhL